MGRIAPLYSIGHSTRSLEELVGLLEENEVDVLADIRTAPGSRRLPQFGRSSLASELPRRGLAYFHLPELGGFRKPRPESRNTAWRNPGFRGYADYMETSEFEAGLQHLLGLQRGEERESAVAMMCAEAVPWRCHRSLVSDALSARGVVVQHILGPGDLRPHTLTPFARVEGTDTFYPGPDRLPLNG